jgi:hypothetical protein
MRRLTDQQKRDRGTYQPCRAPPASVVTILRVPGPPEGLTARQRDTWIDFAREATKLRSYNTGNAGLFEAAVLALAAWREAPEYNEPQYREVLRLLALYNLSCSP